MIGRAAASRAPLWLVEAGCFSFLASLGLVMANAMALALEGHGPRAGRAASIVGALQFGVAAAASGVVSSRYDQSAMAMATTMLGLSLIAALGVFVRGRPRAA